MTNTPQDGSDDLNLPPLNEHPSEVRTATTVKSDPDDPESPRLIDESFVENVLGMARAGMFPAEWAATFNISKATHRTWVMRYENYASAVDVAKTLLQAYWEKKCRENVTNRAFQGQTVRRLMEAHFPEDYINRSIVETTVKDGGKADVQDMSVDELNEEIERHERARQAIRLAQSKTPTNTDLKAGPPDGKNA